MRPRAIAEAAGISMIDVLVATLMLSVALAPALIAINGGLQASLGHEQLVADHYHLRSKFELVLAQPFADLDAEAVAVADPKAPTSYSDAAGSARRRIVLLARYDGDDADGDGDPFSGGDAGLLWVHVALEGSSLELETLTTP